MLGAKDTFDNQFNTILYIYEVYNGIEENFGTFGKADIIKISLSSEHFEPM